MVAGDNWGGLNLWRCDDHRPCNQGRRLSLVYAYSPYGEATALGVDEGNSIQYTGRENDGTELYFYRARYYDPVLKRFVSEDPIGLAGGVNQYRYVGGNPILLVDPLGLWTIGDPLPQDLVDFLTGFADG